MQRGYVAWPVLAIVLATGSVAARADPEVQGLAIATGIIVAAAVATPEHDESSLVAFEAGRFDLIKNVKPATAFSLEYRAGQPLWWKIHPLLGAAFTTEHAFYGYCGVGVVTYWGERVVVTPSFAIGGYSRGSGKDLGHPAVVGRFGIDFEYRFESDWRIGVAFHHMSNGKVLGQAVNPGTEVVGVTVSLPLR